MVILTAIALAALPALTEAQAIAISDTFRLEASKAMTSQVVGTVPSTYITKTTHDVAKSEWVVWYVDGITHVDDQTGAIKSGVLGDYSNIDEGWQQSLRMTDSEAEAFAAHYFSLAGFSGPIVATSIAEENNTELNGAASRLYVEFSPVHQGVLYELVHRSRVSITYSQGRPCWIATEVVPTPPTDMTPDVSLQSAEAIAIGAVFAEYPDASQVVDYQPPAMVIWKPEFLNDYQTISNLDAGHAQLAAQNQGILIYSFGFDTNDTGGKNGTPTHVFTVYVDAESGEVLILHKHAYWGGTKPVVVPFGWDLGSGSLTVMKQGERVQLDSADVERVYPANPPSRGQQVILKRARWRLRAWFDEESGLLWTEQGGVTTYGKPTANLEVALRWLTAN